MKRLIVVLNKVDQVEDPKVLEGKIAALRKVFAKTKFGENLLILPFSAKAEPEFHNAHLK
jgi:translation initiation factor 2 gamma subunit (eIF-2gamma)